MPLEKAPVGSPGFSRNVETEVKAGKPVPQAVAIAYKMSGERQDASPIYEENGEYYFPKPGSMERYGPYASKAEATSAAAKAGVVSDAERDLMGESTGDDEAILGRKDATPTIRQENGQWVITIDEGTNTSIFRLDVREYPTKAEALEYALSNPQYTNRKDSLPPLDRALAAADSLYAKALKTAHKDAERDLPGAGTNEGGYSDADGRSDYAPFTKGRVRIKETGKLVDVTMGDVKVWDANGNEWAYSEVEKQGNGRSDAERDLPGSSTTEGNYGIDAE